MDRMAYTRQLRASTDVHYNCCQSVLLPFAEEMGMTKDQLYSLGEFFNHGMRHGSVCGAVSGAMMVLGALGRDEKEAAALLRRFQEKHGATDCAALLKSSHDRGEPRKPHCDGLVCEMVTALDEIIQSQS